MTLNEPKKEQNVNPDANSETDTSIPELPHPPHLPTPEPPGAIEPSSPTSSSSTPEPHFSAPGISIHLSNPQCRNAEIDEEPQLQQAGTVTVAMPEEMHWFTT